MKNEPQMAQMTQIGSREEEDRLDWIENRGQISEFFWDAVICVFGAAWTLAGLFLAAFAACWIWELT